MFLFKRQSIYHVEYFDETENRIRRVSIKVKQQREALAFLTEFKNKLKVQSTAHSIPIADFRNEYVTFLHNGHFKDYMRSVTFGIHSRLT
ncbi:MAG: hypothetical protein M1470_11625 [Bacteroidetes bacterium]|nr:hypothetical protein [Bacteroidota bacterium]MCL5737640.1 hypothetical protein [Bacteroidota bacterium]